MFDFLMNTAQSAMAWVGNALGGVVKVGLKPIKYFIDSHFRAKVTPELGSVLYCDLWIAAEHSGIYVGEGKIANIVVTGFAEGQVQLSHAADFTSKSTIGRKIYVSSRGQYAVGDEAVAWGAMKHKGQKSFYGLMIKNCHQFSSKCVVDYAGYESSILDKLWNEISGFVSLEWEPTIIQLKRDAEDKLGAEKWLLWDWDNQADQEPEPDWQAQNAFFQNQALTPEFIEYLRQELAQTKAYQAEIADENIPADILKQLAIFQQTLDKVSQKYDEVKALLKICPDSRLSYNDIQACGADFAALAKELETNQQIQLLAKKMGRHYVAEEQKKRCKVPHISKNEMHGTHRSDELMRLLPSELVNLEDEDLEILFYARLLEKNLLTYQLRGITYHDEEHFFNQQKQTGPVVACLDTSGSMDGAPMIKARALLFALANLLKQERRSLYVLLFGASGEIREYTMHGAEELAGLLHFLNQGFNGGTDFKTPLNRALNIIQQQRDFIKADILMISDGDAQLSEEEATQFKQQKNQLDCRVYSVLCAGQRHADGFSDEVMVL